MTPETELAKARAAVRAFLLADGKPATSAEIDAVIRKRRWWKISDEALRLMDREVALRGRLVAR